MSEILSINKNTSNNTWVKTLENENISAEPNVNLINESKKDNSNYNTDKYAASIKISDLSEIIKQDSNIFIENTQCTFLLESGCGFSVITLSFAKQIICNCEDAKCPEKKPHKLKIFLIFMQLTI